MKLNEKAIVDYLERNVGGFISSWLLVSEADACDKDMKELTTKELFEMDQEVFEIGRRNDFYLSKRHHWNEILGLPWNIDFEILYNDCNYFEDKLTHGAYVRYQDKIMIVYDLYKNNDKLIEAAEGSDRRSAEASHKPDDILVGLVAEDAKYGWELDDAPPVPELVFVNRGEIELLEPYCADDETLKRLFRLEATAWQLAKEGKYPFTYDSDVIELSEEDLKCFSKKATKTDSWTLKAWQKVFIHMKSAACHEEAEPKMTIGTLWNVLLQELKYVDFDEEDDGHYLSWFKAYEKNKGKLLSEMELDERQKSEFCSYIELLYGYPSAEQIKAYRKYLKELADSGNEAAIQNMAWGSYGGNELLECDWKEAERCLLMMYESGISKANAADALGYIYYSNRLGEPDYEKAFRFFSEAAKEDITEAKYKLADMYRKGHGTEKDTDKAFRTYMKLYNLQEVEFKNGTVNDLADIALRLGYCYENGEGVEKDLIKARYYFVKAEEAIRLRMDCGGKFGDEVVFSNIQKALERTKQ